LIAGAVLGVLFDRTVDLAWQGTSTLRRKRRERKERERDLADAKRKEAEGRTLDAAQTARAEQAHSHMIGTKYLVRLADGTDDEAEVISVHAQLGWYRDMKADRFRVRSTRTRDEWESPISTIDPDYWQNYLARLDSARDAYGGPQNASYFRQP
jgi:hypothetical protein